MKYKSVVATGRGTVEVLQIVENDLRPPAAGEARLKVLASSVSQDDVACRAGNRPFLPKIPFVPGYAVIGEVDALGPEARGIKIGDRVGALLGTGGYTEILYWDAGQLVPVPNIVDPPQAVTIILNYLTAYQVLHRAVQVKAGDKILVIGASGGVGTALLQLGRVAGLKMYGLASKSKHQPLADLGVIPIDYRTQDFVEVLKQAQPEGLDYVFNGMGEEYFRRGLAVLHRGGRLVHYGGPQSFGHFLLLVLELIFYNLLPNGKKIVGYGTHRGDISQFLEDWAVLFNLLETGQIKPAISQVFPLEEAAQANVLLESGQVIGNLVLLAPELLAGRAGEPG